MPDSRETPRGSIGEFLILGKLEQVRRDWPVTLVGDDRRFNRIFKEPFRKEFGEGG